MSEFPISDACKSVCAVWVCWRLSIQIGVMTCWNLL